MLHVDPIGNHRKFARQNQKDFTNFVNLRSAGLPIHKPLIILDLYQLPFILSNGSQDGGQGLIVLWTLESSLFAYLYPVVIWEIGFNNSNLKA